MANIYKQAIQRRKFIYWGCIAAAFVGSLVVRGVIKIPVGPAKTFADSLSIEARSKTLELTQLSQGDADLGGSAVQLLLIGSRGLAVCALWNDAIEKQKQHEWSELDVSVRSITKLQPHFSSPWMFQSWNIAYNVSVEMDRLDDMYFYIAKGIGVLAEGESLNRNNPDMRYFVAFYYQNKFGVSDKVTTLRSLYHLSCMPDADRDPDALMNPDGSINQAAFEKFCIEHPQFVRRLKETRLRLESSMKADNYDHILAQTPQALIQFLRRNKKVPTRYKEGTTELKDRLKQFPVLPELNVAENSDLVGELDWKKNLGDHEADGFLAARGWFALANKAVPPPSDDPTKVNDNPDVNKYRMPKRPTIIIFRQGPMRAQSYVAERLQKEGWFDNEPWEVDDLVSGDRVWLPKTENGRAVSVKINTPMTAQSAWQESARRWREHGRRVGLYMDAARRARLQALAEEFVRRRGSPNITIFSPTPPMTLEEEQNEMFRAQYHAHSSLTFLRGSRDITNYEKFDVESHALSTDEAMSARKYFFQAERMAREGLDPQKAMDLYRKGFAKLLSVFARRADPDSDGGLDNPNATGLARARDYRDFDNIQEEYYEVNMKYLRLIETNNRTSLRKGMLEVHDMLRNMGQSSTGNPLGGLLRLTVLEPMIPSVGTLPGLFPEGPLDGNDQNGKPWVAEYTRNRIKERMGLIKPAAPVTTLPDGSPPPQ